MSTYTDLVREVRSTLRGYGLIRERVTFLNGAIDASTLTITVDDGTTLSPGIIEIGDECIYVQSVAGNVLTVAPDGRGWDGTTAAIHADNTRVTLDPPYPTWRIGDAINDTIVSVWPTLWAVGTTSFTYNPSVTTYSLPAEAESVLKVTATTLGPSLDQVELHAFSFDSNAPIDGNFATGNCITLRSTPSPGRTVTVVYSKAPTVIGAGDELTASGLRETAKKAIVYGTVAHLLSYVDAARALADSAVASELSETIRVGSATQLAAQLTARFQMELDAEQKRLRLAHPPRVRIGR